MRTRNRKETSGSYGPLTWSSHADLGRQLNVNRSFICKLANEGQLEVYLSRKVKVVVINEKQKNNQI